MLKLVLRTMSGEAFRFAAVGVANTAVGLFAILILQEFTTLGPYGANAGGYAIGLALSFYLNRRWTFRAGGGHIRSQAPRFIAAFAVAYCVNVIVLTVLREAGASLFLAQAGAVFGYSAAFFLLSRLFVFR